MLKDSSHKYWSNDARFFLRFFGYFIATPSLVFLNMEISLRLKLHEPISLWYREIRALFITVIQQLGCQIFRASNGACCFAEILIFVIPEIFRNRLFLDPQIRFIWRVYFKTGAEIRVLYFILHKLCEINNCIRNYLKNHLVVFTHSLELEWVRDPRLPRLSVRFYNKIDSTSHTRFSRYREIFVFI